MKQPPEGRINPGEIAFDIDGVVADTMEVFIALAHERYSLMHLRKEDISCYNLYTCLGLAKGGPRRSYMSYPGR